MNNKGVLPVIAFLPFILAAIIILVIMAIFGLLIGLFIPVILLGASILFFYFAYQSKKENWRVGWAIAGVITLIILVVPTMFSLVGQPVQTQGRFEGQILDYATTVNQDLSFRFSSDLASSFGGQNFPATIQWKIDNGTYSQFGYTIQIINDGLPHPVYPVKPLIEQDLFTISYDTLKTFGNGKHIITFQLFYPNSNQIAGEINFEIWIDDESCQELGGNMEVYEAYSAGQTISLQSFRWSVAGFCYQRPLRITDLDGTRLRQGLEEYALLLNGSTITVPLGEVWVFDYIAQQTPDIPIQCPEGSVYDSQGQQCVITPPVVFSCSGNGIFDPVAQVCVIQPESRIICELGTYNTELGKCVYFVPEDQTQIVCPAGSEITTTPEEIIKCVFEGETEYVCSAGHLNLEKTPPTCEVNPLVDTTVIKLPIIGELNYVNFFIIVVSGLIILFSSIILILLLVKK